MSIVKVKSGVYQIRISCGYSFDPTKGKNKQNLVYETIHGSKQDAIRREAELKIKTANSPHKAQTNGQMTLSQFFAYYKENYSIPKLSEATRALDDLLFSRIESVLGAKKLRDIKPTDLLNLYKYLGECKRHDRKGGYLCAETIRKHHKLISKLYEKAIRWQLAFANPCKAVDPPGSTKYHNTKTILDDVQTPIFLDIINQDTTKHQLWATMAFGLGLRRGELFGLRWGDIDFDARTVYIQRATKPKRGGGIIVNGTKNDTSIRMLSIPDAILPLLRQHREDQLNLRYLLANKYEGASTFEDDYLFTTDYGAPACPDSFNTWLRRLTKKHSLPAISPHSLRHMYTTYLVAGGLDIKTVSSTLGHANPSTTMLVYTHLFRPKTVESANIINRILTNQS